MITIDTPKYLLSMRGYYPGLTHNELASNPYIVGIVANILIALISLPVIWVIVLVARFIFEAFKDLQFRHVLKLNQKTFKRLFSFAKLLIRFCFRLNFSKLKLNLILKIMKNGLDEEEYIAIRADLLSRWNQIGLTAKQIERRELMFFVEVYWGRFQNWAKFLKILSSLKMK